VKLNHRIPISLYDFIRTGKFDYVKIGMTKEQLLQQFPDPEDWSYEKIGTILQYGDMATLNCTFRIKRFQLSLMTTFLK
jgi:hypothetical protein